ncbi:FtsH protease activity modulator HflK [Indioceanicola profundi]|uniref:FtsH protease activity modulator HflK n=1 Tax=Indioceanicola profundi TaxID=2220096 RepID=UPI000E6A9C9E|nr:FtsH protease activity modulator HflK [Indioceanicola profundi]
MPWNNQSGGGGGGPWGSPPGGGNNNPWGRPSGGGGSQPPGPDLEELLRRSQDRFKRVMPGGFGSGKGIALALLVVGGLWMASGIYRVQQDEAGVVLRFGEYVRTELPGLRWHLPSPIETVYTPQVTTVNRMEIGFRSVGDNRRGGSERDVEDESLMLTGDENIIDIDFTVFWKVKEEAGAAADYLFNIRDPEQTVKKAAESAMREVIGQTDIQPALTEARQQIETRTREILQAMLDSYDAGIAVTQVQLQKVDPPSAVVDAFNDVQRARQDRERLRNEAEAYRNDIIPRARGEAERLIQEASAYREEVVSLAQGDAQRFVSVLEAYNSNPEVTAKRMYLETMEAVLGGTNKIIMDGGQNGTNGVLPYLPLDQLTNRLRQQGPASGPAQPAPQSR